MKGFRPQALKSGARKPCLERLRSSVPHAPTRLSWPPGGVRQLAVSPQLLTVSGAPFLGLWLCLIEDHGYGRSHPRSSTRTVCEVVGGGHGITGRRWEAEMKSDMRRHPTCGQGGHGECSGGI